jgi:hypothetical protein
LKITDSTATFTHPQSEEVSVTEISAPEGETSTFKIERIGYCGVYIPLNNLKNICLSACFERDDFIIWGCPDGHGKISAKDDPNMIVFETHDNGRLHHIPQSDSKEFIESCD